MSSLSLRAYARSRKERGLTGGSLQAVQRAIETGRIVKAADGKIDPTAADSDWDEKTHPLKYHGSPKATTKKHVVGKTAALSVVATDLSAKDVVTGLHDRGMVNAMKLAKAFGLEGLYLDAAGDLISAWLVASIGQDLIDQVFGESIPRLNRDGQRLKVTHTQDRQIDELVNIAHRALGLEAF
jgi:hypothetical protein